MWKIKFSLFNIYCLNRRFNIDLLTCKNSILVKLRRSSCFKNKSVYEISKTLKKCIYLENIIVYISSFNALFFINYELINDIISIHHRFIITTAYLMILLEVLSEHYWKLYLQCLRLLTTWIIYIYQISRNEHSSPHQDTRLRQLLTQTSKVWYLQVFSKLVESA